eukprot:TRINITY_DN16709_c0_g1_i3.p1 TRINITY_DN16709_c0_g1~~TRINITY_DN16709_c0_g1_i3.p1  ORF type:complete len:187 (+),score=3.83 TRINITY_DN16709_c0_g1_i3:24-584(+)
MMFQSPLTICFKGQQSVTSLVLVLVIVADCPRCNKRVIQQVKLFKKRTATFDLNKGANCPECRLHLTDLQSPCLAECDYNYKGEKSDGQKVNQLEWKTVQANHILYWNEEEEHIQETKKIINWTQLKIFIKVFDTNYCVACQQKFLDDKFQEGECGHRYHPACYGQIKNALGHCVSEGCCFKFAQI